MTESLYRDTNVDVVPTMVNSEKRIYTGCPLFSDDFFEGSAKSLPQESKEGEMTTYSLREIMERIVPDFPQDGEKYSDDENENLVILITNRVTMLLEKLFNASDKAQVN